MPYFPDLSDYVYLNSPLETETAVNIGWLDENHPYQKGPVSEEVVKVLFGLCETPQKKTRGYHQCPFCRSFWPSKELGVLMSVDGKEIRLGSAEIRIRCGDKTYAAPNMIVHYIKKHNYLPPKELIQCLEVNRTSQPKHGEDQRAK